MLVLNTSMMEYLSFPDFDVQKIEFSENSKKLKVYIEGAWLDMNGGHMLGKGVISFDNWQNLTIRAFDETWMNVEIKDFEPLKDICEVNFTNSNASLSGFAKYSALWTEWNIQNAIMQAEFEEKLS